VLFISLGIAWYIGDRTGDPSMGFFSLAGFYILLAVIAYFTRDKLIKAPIINAIIKKIAIHEED
jgi:tetrahydromethanopterin S-methyltransferase subunit C